MESRPVRHAIVLATLLLSGQPNPAAAEDQIDRLLRSGRVPGHMIREYGYSDFTNPLGKFLDFLAAGAFVRARALQPAACAEWLATRQDSPLTGKVWIWETEIDLNTLCTQR
ncbi:MAG: hypothetical protein EXR07_15935 [Acetobacteraceae bacterium]|nr:hypothetical protein [Acetobacteraceae bacterium]